MQTKAFTLIELLLSMTIISILMAIVLVAVNPGRQFAQSRNAQRSANVHELLNAVWQYTMDNDGNPPAAITLVPTTVGSGAGQIDLCPLLNPTYIAPFTIDPSASGSYLNDCSDYNTGYQISKNNSGRITATAPSAELGETISFSR